MEPVPARGLVLAGGGLTGIAWELGLLCGLARAGVDLLQADLVVGTSAGSTVGAQATSGTPLEELVSRQLDPDAGGEITPVFDIEEFRATMLELAKGAEDATEIRRRIGRLALETETVPEETRRGVIAGRLPNHDWPDRELVVTAVDAETGEFATFDRRSGVELVDAVAASSAVPGVWPPVTIGARRYIDGGMRSGTNADLAGRCRRVVVLVPFQPDPLFQERLDAELAQVGRDHAFVAWADAEAEAAFGQRNLDPSRRPAAARAGLNQAPALVEALKEFWEAPLP